MIDKTRSGDGYHVLCDYRHLRNDCCRWTYISSVIVALGKMKQELEAQGWSLHGLVEDPQHLCPVCSLKPPRITEEGKLVMLLLKSQTGGLHENSAQIADHKSFYVGATWDGKLDLELMAVPIADDRHIQEDVCYYGRLESFGGNIKHLGYALEGDAPSGDESMVLKLDELPQHVTAIVIGLVAFNVPSMLGAKNIKLTVRDGGDVNAFELLELPMTEHGVDKTTILVACAIERAGGGFWEVRSIDEARGDFRHGIEAINGMMTIATTYL